MPSQLSANSQEGVGTWQHQEWDALPRCLNDCTNIVLKHQTKVMKAQLSEPSRLLSQHRVQDRRKSGSLRVEGAKEQLRSLHSRHSTW